MTRKIGLSKLLASFLGCLILVLGGMVAAVNALPLPAADFQGSVYVDLDNGSIYNTTEITEYTDVDGRPSDLIAPNDPFIGQSVSGFGFTGFAYDWDNDVLTIDPTATANFIVGSSSDPYLTAVATNIVVHKTGDRDYRIDALLTNQQYYHTGDSLFMSQYEEVTGSNNIGQILTWDVVFELPLPDPNDPNPNPYDYKINVSGTIAPVPEPATIMLMGAGLLGIGSFARRRYSKKS